MAVAQVDAGGVGRAEAAAALVGAVGVAADGRDVLGDEAADLVQVVGVVALVAAFELQLPVADVGVLPDAAGDLTWPVGERSNQSSRYWRARPRCSSRVGPFVRQAGEDQAAVVADLGLVEAALDRVDLAGAEAAAQADAGQRAVIAVDPAVVLAAEEVGVAVLALADRRAAVGAAVDQHVDSPSSSRLRMTGMRPM